MTTKKPTLVTKKNNDDAPRIKVEEEKDKPKNDPGLPVEQSLTVRKTSHKVVMTLRMSRLSKDGTWEALPPMTSADKEFAAVDTAFLRAIKIGYKTDDGPIQTSEGKTEQVRIDSVLVAISCPINEKLIKSNQLGEDDEQTNRSSLDNFFGQRRAPQGFKLEICYAELIGKGWTAMKTGSQEYTEFDEVCLAAQRIQHRIRSHNQWIYWIKVQRNEPTSADSLFAGFE